MSSSHPAVVHVMQYFHEGEGLPADLQKLCKLYARLARELDEMLPDNPEKTYALRKLLESKDAAVRTHRAGA